jgi:predicted small lipoprotein YifL
MRTKNWLGMMLVGFLAACGGNTPLNPPPAVDSGAVDTGTPGDATVGDSSRTDAGGTDTARTDTARADTAGPRSPAGNGCMAMDDPACGDALQCDTSVVGGICTNRCMNGTAASEQAECGGRGSTCLSGNEMTNNGFCTRACDPGARSEATGACRAGYVCTGFWLQRMMADDTGCLPFCANDMNCGGMTPRCDTRVGTCSTRAPDMTRQEDGTPCNPMMTEMVPGEMNPRNTQCRGRCFRLSSMRPTQGMCGSFINLRDATGCPDAPEQIQPRAPMGDDNLGICIFRSCMTDCDCTGALRCVYPENAMGMPVTMAPRLCNYPSTAQPTGVPCMGRDGGTDATATDATATDAGPSPTDTGTSPTDTGTSPTDTGTSTDAGGAG